MFSDDIATVTDTSVVSYGSPKMAISSRTAADLEMTGKTIIRQLVDAHNKMHFCVKYETMTDPSG